MEGIPAARRSGGDQKKVFLLVHFAKCTVLLTTLHLQMLWLQPIHTMSTDVTWYCSAALCLTTNVMVGIADWLNSKKYLRLFGDSSGLSTVL
jgi:hypothetical protein